MRDDEWDAAWDEDRQRERKISGSIESAISDYVDSAPIAAPDPTVRISMADGFLGTPLPPKLPVEVARGSTDIPLELITAEQQRLEPSEPRTAPAMEIPVRKTEPPPVSTGIPVRVNEAPRASSPAQRRVSTEAPHPKERISMRAISVPRRRDSKPTDLEPERMRAPASTPSLEHSPATRPASEHMPALDHTPVGEPLIEARAKAKTDETKVPTERARKLSAGSVRAELAALQRRTRQRLVVAAVAAPVLFGVAFVLGRQPQDAPVATPPVVKTIESRATEPVMVERSLAQALLDRAETAIRNGHIAAPPGDNALEFLLDAEKQEPGNPRVTELRDRAVKELLAAADQLWKAGKQDSARTLYADALLFDPTIAIAKQRSRSRRIEPEPSKDVAWLVAEIDLAIIERRLVAPSGRNALELLQQLRRVDPANEAVRRLGAEVAKAVASEPKAEAPVALEKPRDPTLARQLVVTGNTQLGSGRLADARSSFERAVTADSGAHAALAGLAEVAYNESDYTRAVLAAKRAIALAPSNGGYRMLLGKAYYKLLRYDDAITQWTKAGELDPRNTAAAKNIEMARHRMGR